MDSKDDPESLIPSSSKERRLGAIAMKVEVLRADTWGGLEGESAFDASHRVSRVTT